MLDLGDRHDGENVDRAELQIDHRAVAEFRADAQIALDERRQRGDPLARIDRAFVERIHRHGAARARAHRQSASAEACDAGSSAAARARAD